MKQAYPFPMIVSCEMSMGEEYDVRLMIVNILERIIVVLEIEIDRLNDSDEVRMCDRMKTFNTLL